MYEFQSDNERRVLGFVTDARDTVELLSAAILADPHTAIEGPEAALEVGEVLKDLEAHGLAKQKNGSWSVTKAGQEALGGNWPS